MNQAGLPRPLRVCHLGKYYPPAAGGMESHVQTLARAQAALGAAVQVICVNHCGPGGQDVTWQALAGTATQIDEDGPVRVVRLGRAACVARLELCAGLLPQLASLSSADLDVLHLHVPNPSMILALALVQPRVPLVITHHSDAVRQRCLSRLLRPVEHLVYARARRILTTSPRYLDGSPLLRQYADHVETLPMGIDLDPYLHPGRLAQDAAERLRRSHGQPLWLSVGRLTYYKGLPCAIAALSRTPGKLLVIGQGPLEAALREQVIGAGVADRIVWAGQVRADELIGAYHAATALWFPSTVRSEGFGLVQVEAMASGCPVINAAIAHSGVPWVSPHEETGLTAPVNDSLALAAAARRLLQEPGLRERLARGARERARKEFACQLMAERSLAIYDRALACEAPSPSSAVASMEGAA